MYLHGTINVVMFAVAGNDTRKFKYTISTSTKETRNNSLSLSLSFSLSFSQGKRENLPHQVPVRAKANLSLRHTGARKKHAM